MSINDPYNPVRHINHDMLQAFIVTRFLHERGFGFARAKQDGPLAHKDEECIFYLEGGHQVTCHPWSEQPFFGLHHGEDYAPGRPFGLNLRRPHMIDIMADTIMRGSPRRKLTRWCDIVDFRKIEDAIARPPHRRVVAIRGGEVVGILWEGTDIIQMSELFPQEDNDPIAQYFAAYANHIYPDGIRIERYVGRNRNKGLDEWSAFEGDVRAPASVVEARRYIEMH